MKTLIVEDDLICRRLLQTALARYGECHVAGNGVEAVAAYLAAAAARQPYDLICMDIVMPEMDGQTALTVIREAEVTSGIAWDDRVKIVMTTALDDNRQVMSSFRGLCDAYIRKPVDVDALIAQLTSLKLPV